MSAAPKLTNVDEFPIIVRETYKELGIRRIRPMKKWVFVRTDDAAQKTSGGIWLPPKKARFYDGPPHLRIVTATVLAAGPKTWGLKPGDRVAFKRTLFTWWYRLNNGQLVGSIHEEEIIGEPLSDEE